MITGPSLGKGTMLFLALALALAYALECPANADGARPAAATLRSPEDAVRGDFLLIELHQNDGSTNERFVFVASNSRHGSLFIIPLEGYTGHYVEISSLKRLGIGLVPPERRSEAAAAWRAQQPIDTFPPLSEVWQGQ